MSTILEEILSTKTKRIKSDDDFFKRCLVKSSESYKRQVKASVNNFNCWLNFNERNIETFLIQIKGIEDETVREEKLIDIFNAFFEYMLSEHTCPTCFGKDKSPESEKWKKVTKGKCQTCFGKKTMKAVRPSTANGILTHLRKYLGYYGLSEVFSKTCSEQVNLPKIVEEQAEPLTNEMFEELLTHTRSSERKLYLKSQETDGMRPKE